MKYSNQQIREAILSTASLFERRPDLFDFNVLEVPACDSPGCAIGYFAHFLGIRPEDDADFGRVCKDMGLGSDFTFYQNMDAVIGIEDSRDSWGPWSKSADAMASTLRLFADSKHFTVRS